MTTDADNSGNNSESHPSSISRRELVATLGAGAVLGALHGCTPAGSGTASTGTSLSDPIHYSTARALADAIRAGDVTSTEVVEACLGRIDAVNGQLNAVFQIQRDAALGRAAEADEALGRGEVWGPLHGVPMTIKDSLDTAGVITTGGTQGRATFVPERDATVVARLKEAGAILLGKTNTPEFTLSFETSNLVYGMTHNPYDVSRSPGGSSGGAAAIVAAGGSPFDIGSDYGGSIRLPSHFCGLAGIKPSAGRVPRTGHIYPFGGVQDSFQQIGPLARSVDDLAMLLDIIRGPDGVDPGLAPLIWGDVDDVELSGLRVSFHTDNGIATPTPETQSIVRAAAGSLEGVVAEVVEATPGPLVRTMDLFGMYLWDGGAAVRRLAAAAGTTELSLAERPFVLGPDDLDAMVKSWYDYRSDMHGFMADYDAIVCPVNAGPAPLHGPEMDDLTRFSYTISYNLTGWPGAVVRGGTSPEGMPIGVQIVTRPGREDVALRLAKHVEQELGGYQRPAI